MASALWRYMVPIRPAPSLHEIATGLFVPEIYDLMNLILEGFGTSTLVMGGMDECGQTTETNAANQRAFNYNRLL
jgi:hypothetical protein